MQKVLSWGLIILEIFVGITSASSGVQLVLTNGLGMPIPYLKNSPFTSFLIPGLILIFVVGGLHLLAGFLTLKNKVFKLEISAIAAFGLLIWIFTEMYIIGKSSVLQTLYFSVGILELVLILLIQKFYLLDLKKT